MLGRLPHIDIGRGVVSMVSSLLAAVSSVVGSVLGFYAGLAVTLILIALLVVKLRADGYHSTEAESLNCRLNVPAVVLLFAFASVIGFKLLSVLS
jgi:membrane protein YqaA with SNARE-associated domain